MASWRDGLRPGSFRGVPFFCRDTSNLAGQRLAVFEMPDSDSVYVQALGRGIKEYRLELYVAGDDYMRWRDQLEAALDADGPGTLVHPYKGPLQVYCRYPATVREEARAGRAAFFDAVFFESAGAEPPLPAADTAGTAVSASAAVQPALSGAYRPVYDGAPSTVQSAFSAALVSVQTALSDALTAVGDAAAQFGQDLATLAGFSPDDGAGYAGALQALFSNYVLNAVAAAVDVVDASLAPGFQDWTRLPAMPGDPSFGLASLAGTDLTPASAQGAALANWTMLTSLVQGSAAAALVTLYAQTDFASAADADAAREQVHDLLVARIEAAAGDDALVQAWRGALAASVADLTARAASAPEVATLTTAAPLPALVLAEFLYQDGSEAPALVQRNAAPHPLFMPLAVEYLQS